MAPKGLSSQTISKLKTVRELCKLLANSGNTQAFDQDCDLSLYGAKCDIWLGHIDVANLPILDSVFPTTKSFTY